MLAVGLRERKKNQTRQLIADTAGELFRARGFDDVTLDEVAAGAQVSKKTVFNYFPTKEDLVFDRADDREARLVAAVKDRPAGMTVLESFRRLCLDQTRLLPELRRRASPEGGFFDLVEGHPALRRKSHEITMRLMHTLAVALAEDGGRDQPDLMAELTAWTLIGAQRTLYRSLRARAAGPLRDDTIRRAHRRDVNRVFDRLRDGI